LALALALLAALAAAFWFAPSAYEVVDKAKGPPVVPYQDSGLVYEIRVLDALTIYADEESRLMLDKLTSAALVACATMAFMALLLLRAAGAPSRLRRFFACAGFGLSYLALDELFAIHETLGHNLQFLADLPGVDRPDDLVFLAYAVPVAAFAWAFRDILRARPGPLWLLAAGTFFFAVAAAGDLAGVGLDEAGEGAAGICLLVAFVAITASTLREHLGLSVAAQPGEPALPGGAAPLPATAGRAVARA
jgi:hypothetical protein